jgi:hypothetical protein
MKLATEAGASRGEIRSFVEALFVAASQGERLKAAWGKGGPWRPS